MAIRPRAGVPLSLVLLAALACGGGTVPQATIHSPAASTPAWAGIPSPVILPPAPGVNPVPPPAGFPVGTYSGTGGITGPDILTFKSDGTFTQVSKVNAAHYISGTYTVKDDQLSIRERTDTVWEEGVCGNVGTYTWTYAPPVLTLSVLSDDCGYSGFGRGEDLSGPWQKS